MRPQRIFTILITAITVIQIHNQTGRCIRGRTFATHTAVNTMSAAVSNFAPNALTAFVFLATVPSTKSVIPQNKYKI